MKTRGDKVLISSRLTTYLNRSVNRFLTHTYTWTDNDQVPVLDINDDPVVNDWGQIEYTDASPIADKPCLFLFEEVVSNGTGGPVTLRIPTLYVRMDDPVSVDDVIANILQRDGTTVLLSFARVESIDNTAEGGNTALKVLRLSGATTL